MALVHNLSPNPSLKTSGTGWFGPSGWARVAFGDPTLPRPAVWKGTTAGDIATPRFAVTPGKYYRAAVWMRNLAPTIFDTAINWYASGGAYLTYSAGNAYNRTGDTTFQADSGVALAPAGAAEGLLNIVGLDGAAEFTAVIVREFDTALAASAADMTFFDGDSARAVWDVGTNGKSTLDTGSTFTLPMTVTPPVGRIVGAKARGRFEIAMNLAPPRGAIGLTAQVSYDDVRGRIRIHVGGLVPEAIRAVVFARAQGTTKWAEIRGGRVALVGNAFQRTVDHYEFTAGAVMEYKIVAYSTPENVPPEIVQQRVLTVRDDLSGAWLKFIVAPLSNRKVTLGEWDAFERQARSDIYPVSGRRDPVVVTDSHTAKTTTLRFYTQSLAERDALDEALGQGLPAFLQTPARLALPSMYISIGSYRWERTRRRGFRHMFTVPVTEISAPPLSVYGAGMTWQMLMDRYDTWADVVEAYDSWRDVTA
ncbi:hypothetical protein [Pseudonocardia pini]|uniref:hypothetical protein n=1 Tax=Pseudonocardia pini TaxID=2758030 RepID=UPI0015F060F6|nr:hypothetical protein [Pseudonocardia pini]